MSAVLIITLCLAVIGSLWFSTLSYALRNLSRAKLTAYLEAVGKDHNFEPVANHAGDLIFITAIGRLFSNVTILVCVLRLLSTADVNLTIQYSLAVVITLTITLFCSIAIPNALAKYSGPQAIGFFAPVLIGLRIALLPVTYVMHGIDSAVRQITNTSDEPQPDQIEQEILSAVQEGEKEGVVDTAERQMFEAVIRFGDTTVIQVMTARPEMIGIDVHGTLEEIKEVLEESGHSRLPVYEGSLDKIIGVLYARDLLKFLGRPATEFDVGQAIRSAYYVPETKQLKDLLNDFRVKKVHMAIVLDEYGGTSGLITIEDVLEELVGDISDEHEPQESPMLRQTGALTWEADARVYIDEFNRRTGLHLPEDAGYDTLGGYVSTSIGHIPLVGEVFKSPDATFTTLDAEPQKINRIRIDITSVPKETATAPQGL
jgi:CBS domain containing-hemolysin-like protein